MHESQLNHLLITQIYYFCGTKLLNFLKNFGALVLFLTILHQKENEKKDRNVCLNEVAWKCQNGLRWRRR